MKHMTEQELIAYREGVVEQRAAISEHLAACHECRDELERIETVLAALDTLPVPIPARTTAAAFGSRLRHDCRRDRKHGWQAWFQPRRLGAAGAILALVVAAFLIGRITRRDTSPDNIASTEQVRERVLIVAVGEHLGHSERMLVELSNAEPSNPAQKQ